MAAPTPPETPKPAARSDAVAVISATGAFRLLLILLAVWTFFEGFALFTGGLSALSLGGHDRTAEQILGAQMIVFVPVYALLAWQRERYRLLIWVPYGAQLAIILPTTWGLLFRGDTGGFLLLVVSATFFALLFYFWWHSHPLDFFSGDDDEEEYDDDEDDDADDDEAEGDQHGQDDGDHDPSSTARRPARARDVPRRAGRFRRRDG
jgi:hypothetical protein